MVKPGVDLVIGSGPAALATLHALMEQGRRVKIVDVGQTLEPDRQALRASLGAAQPDEWNREALNELRKKQLGITDSAARFGSRHAIRRQKDIVANGADEVALQSSHGFGGLSNIWGAAVLPWSPSDLSDWPIAPDALRDHYRAVAGIIPVAGTPASYDDILDSGGLDLRPPLPATRQAEELGRRLKPIKEPDGASFWPGPSRQAVHEGCRSCGLCLYGCPYHKIFSAADPMADLIASGRVDYVKAEAVRIFEEGDSVVIETSDGGPPVKGDRLFVAAGVLETARLMFESRSELGSSGLILKDSRHFFTPLISRWTSGHPTKSGHHTLAIAFLELHDIGISPRIVHSQLYGWNDFYAREMSQNYAYGLSFLSPVFERVARRLIVAQTFLHSDHCAKIVLRPTGDALRRLSVEVIDAPGFLDSVSRIRDRLSSYLRRAGLYSIRRAGSIGLPGSSFHIGGTLPMADAPGPTQTDLLGRPRGAKRIHVVDASVLPTIPASTITFSVMANAHRIASKA